MTINFSCKLKQTLLMIWDVFTQASISTVPAFRFSKKKNGLACRISILCGNCFLLLITWFVKKKVQKGTMNFWYINNYVLCERPASEAKVGLSPCLSLRSSPRAPPLARFWYQKLISEAVAGLRGCGWPKRLLLASEASLGICGLPRLRPRKIDFGLRTPSARPHSLS